MRTAVDRKQNIPLHIRVCVRYVWVVRQSAPRLHIEIIQSQHLPQCLSIYKHIQINLWCCISCVLCMTVWRRQIGIVCFCQWRGTTNHCLPWNERKNVLKWNFSHSHLKLCDNVGNGFFGRRSTRSFQVGVVQCTIGKASTTSASASVVVAVAWEVLAMASNATKTRNCSVFGI